MVQLDEMLHAPGNRSHVPRPRQGKSDRSQVNMEIGSEIKQQMNVEAKMEMKMKMEYRDRDYRKGRNKSIYLSAQNNQGS